MDIDFYNTDFISGNIDISIDNPPELG